MWRLEKQSLGDLAMDLEVIRIARAFNWLPSDVRKQDRRDLILLAADVDAERGVEAELKRREAERKVIQ